MGHFGPRVMGKQRFAAEKAVETATSGGQFGPRVTGRKAPPTAAPIVVDPATTVNGVLEQIKAGGDLMPLIDAELSRKEGGRVTVVKALMQAAAKRGLPTEVLDKLAESLTPKG